MTTAAEQGLIRLDGVTKVFYTDEVETHALSGVHLEIKNGEFLSIAGPSGCGKSTLLSILGLLDSPTEGNYWINTQAVANLSLSGVQPDWRSHGVRKRRAAAHLPQHGRGRAQEASAGSAGARGHGPPHEALPVAALWRSATARRCGARSGGLSF